MADKLTKAMSYDKLWEQWLESHRQPNPEGLSPVINNPNAPQNTYLTPENMMTLLNAVSPYDLYTNPNSNPTPNTLLDYPTSAFNIDNTKQMGYGIPEAIAMASQSPTKLNQLRSMQDEAIKSFGYPSSIRKVIMKQHQPQMVYEHEVAHYQDPRLNRYKLDSAPNMGYNIYDRMEQPVLMREVPAMMADERYRNALLRAILEKEAHKLPVQ